MLNVVLAVSPLLAVLLLTLWRAAHLPACPDCGDRLPAFCSPFRKRRRMWLAGGYHCARCGCETDAAGTKVAADAPLPPTPVGSLALAGCLALLGLGLAGWLVGNPSVAVARPNVVAPMPGPPPTP